MIKIIKEAQVRSEEDNRNLRETVAGIIGEIRARGDAALKEYNEKFDGCTRESLRVSREEIDAAYKELGEQELADLKAAHHNIEAFAETVRRIKKNSLDDQIRRASDLNELQRLIREQAGLPSLVITLE